MNLTILKKQALINSKMVRCLVIILAEVPEILRFEHSM